MPKVGYVYVFTAKDRGIPSNCVGIQWSEGIRIDGFVYSYSKTVHLCKFVADIEKAKQVVSEVIPRYFGQSKGQYRRAMYEADPKTKLECFRCFNGHFYECDAVVISKLIHEIIRPINQDSEIELEPYLEPA